MTDMDFCYVVVPGGKKGKRIAIVTKGETGYYPTKYDHYETEDECKEHVRLINEKLGIPPDVERSARDASMFGWDCNAAQLALQFFRVRKLTEPAIHGSIH